MNSDVSPWPPTVRLRGRASEVRGIVREMIGCTFVVVRGDGEEPEIRVALLESLPVEGASLSFHEETEEGATFIVQHVHFTVSGALLIGDQSPETVIAFPVAQIEAQITLVADEDSLSD